MRKGCGQVNIPIVDNTRSACDSIISSECITVTKISETIGNIEGGDLNDLISKISSQLDNIYTEIYKLNKRVNNLLSTHGGINSLDNG